MIMATESFQDLVKKGDDLILRGRYNSAYEIYNKALEINPNHYLIRNALGELMFIKKEYLAAADNFYLAANDAGSRIDLGLLSSDTTSKLKLIMKKNDEVKKATQLLEDYSKKAGIALFAYQYDEPTEINPRQAKINQFRIKVDPCGYCGSTELEPKLEARLEREVIAIGKRFLKMMNAKTIEESGKALPLQMVMDSLLF